MKLRFKFGIVFDHHVVIKKVGCPVKFLGHWWSEIVDTFKRIG